MYREIKGGLFNNTVSNPNRPFFHGGIHNNIGICYSVYMNEDFPFTQLEYAKLLGISKECLRGRRRAGKLEGQYIVKSNQYFYARPRPNNEKNHSKNPHPKRVRRRGVSYTGEKLNYRNHALQNHNEMKMLLKLQKRVDPKLLALVPDALARIHEEQKKELEARSAAQRPLTNSQRTRNYGTPLIDCTKAIPTFTEKLNQKIEEKKYSYY